MRMWKTVVVGCEIEDRDCRRGPCRLSWLTSVAVVALLISTNNCFAQDNSFGSARKSGTDQNGFSQAFESRFNAGQTQNEVHEPWKFEARLHLEKGTSEGYLVLQVDLEEGHYIYSVSAEGSPAPTKISVAANPSVQTRGVFAPNVSAEVTQDDPVFHRRIEKHKGQVQFFVPCQLDANIDFQAAGMPVIEFNGQVCSSDGVCIPISGHKITAKFAGFFERKNQSASQTAQPTPNGEKQISLGR